jgi:hypothetical protein
MSYLTELAKSLGTDRYELLRIRKKYIRKYGQYTPKIIEVVESYDTEEKKTYFLHIDETSTIVKKRRM